MTDEPERLDLAAYALGVLESSSRARVESHLRVCADCARELAEYRAISDMLPQGLQPEPAPPKAWEAVTARIRGRDKGQAGTAFWATWRSRSWARAAPVLQPALSVVLVAAVIGLLVWNASLQARLSDPSGAINRLANLPEESVVALGGQSAGTGGHLFMSENRQQGGLVVAGLPVLPSGRLYQVWFIRQDQSRASAGTFRVDTFGQAVVLVTVPQPAGQFGGVAVTEEPDGGSSSATGHDVLAGPIYEQ